MAGRVTYLTTLDLEDSWLQRLAITFPELDIHRHVVDSAGDIPRQLWASIDVLHTSTVFPDPNDAPRLRWIQLDTSGADHVASHPIWQSPIEITTIGGIAPVPMAEFATYALLALAHHQPRLNQLGRSRQWPTANERLASLTPLLVDGATASIVGYGRIGREIGRVLRILGLHVIGVSRTGLIAGPADALFDGGRSDPGDDEVERRRGSDLADVLTRTDYLIVTVPYTQGTAGMIGAAELAALRPGACVINISRGGVVDEGALLDALDNGQVAYAALDVFDDEPLPATSPWWHHERVLMTPHVAGLAPRYAEQVRELLTTNLRRLSDDLPLLNRVDRATGY
ncbi:D-2-hydroxyacid dehydrogenase [soil metagenome]